MSSTVTMTVPIKLLSSIKTYAIICLDDCSILLSRHHNHRCHRRQHDMLNKLSRYCCVWIVEGWLSGVFEPKPSWWSQHEADTAVFPRPVDCCRLHSQPTTWYDVYMYISIYIYILLLTQQHTARNAQVVILEYDRGERSSVAVEVFVCVRLCVW